LRYGKPQQCGRRKPRQGKKEERKTEHARIIPLFQNKNVYESLTSISLFHRETGKTGAFRGAAVEEDEEGVLAAGVGEEEEGLGCVSTNLKEGGGRAQVAEGASRRTS
jgi:hypothetical protein